MANPVGFSKQFDILKLINGNVCIFSQKLFRVIQFLATCSVINIGSKKCQKGKREKERERDNFMGQNVTQVVYQNNYHYASLISFDSYLNV